MFYVLHANWLYKTMYALIKPFLSPKTKEKIKIVARNEDLLEYFDQDQLLPEHGGSSKYVYNPIDEY